MTAAEVAEAVRSFRFRFVSEDELQAAIASALRLRGFWVDREVRVVGGRIDLVVEETVGVEVKVAGTPDAVLRQVDGYLRDPRLEGIVLVSARGRHVLPSVLRGKPVEVVSLAKGGL